VRFFLSYQSLTLGIRADIRATDLEDHDHYTRRQKRLGAMDPNMKLLIENLLKQVRDEIKEA
jgi:hypothetical protein